MANPEHVVILRQGVETWNQFIRKNVTYDDKHRPSLTFADLHKADLRNIEFGGTDLSGVNLKNAKLYRADFGYTSTAYFPEDRPTIYLFPTDLSEADLSGAELSGANFYRTQLVNTNLGGTQLFDTTFNDVIFYNTNFSDAKFGGVNLINVDLSGAEGLENVTHNLNSHITIDTIIRSHGNIPEIFLRNAGIPQSIIEQIPALIGSLKPIEYYSCFISYSSKNEDFAHRLHADLQAARVRCWFAPEDMKIGDRIRSHIDESIRLYDKLLIVLSEYSVASQWVEHEVETALGKELEGRPNVLFPIRLDEAVMQSRTGWASHIRLTRNIGDFTQWKNHDDYQKALERLLRDLKASS